MLGLDWYWSFNCCTSSKTVNWVNESSYKVQHVQNAHSTVPVEQVLCFLSCTYFGGSKLEKGDSQNHYSKTCPIVRVYVSNSCLLSWFKYTINFSFTQIALATSNSCLNKWYGAIHLWMVWGRHYGFFFGYLSNFLVGLHVVFRLASHQLCNESI